MTGADLKSIRSRVDDALRAAKDAERWSMACLHGDKASEAHMAWVAAQKAVRELTDISRKLDAIARA